MRLVVQRVLEASVSIDNKVHSAIEKGLLVLLGIHSNDGEKQINWCVDKLVHLRIFSDDHGKMNLSVKDISGEILVISQFTLYANCRKGRRPDYLGAAPPAIALALYNQFIKVLTQDFSSVKSGEFGANMQVSLINDGPVTLLIDS